MQIKLYNLHEANILKNYYQPLLQGKIFRKKEATIDAIDYVTDNFQGSQIVGIFNISGKEQTVDISRLIEEFGLKTPEEVLIMR